MTSTGFTENNIKIYIFDRFIVKIYNVINVTMFYPELQILMDVWPALVCTVRVDCTKSSLLVAPKGLVAWELGLDKAVSIPAACIAEKNSCPIIRRTPHPELKPPTWASCNRGPYPQQCGSHLSTTALFFKKKD